jgi:hypothetical protein
MIIKESVMAKKKKIPPAKIKYDQAHPVISIRVNMKLKSALEEIRQNSGKSVGDILREALQTQAPSVKDSYSHGFNDAKEIYAVYVKCRICGGNLLLDHDADKKMAAKMLHASGLVHNECMNKNPYTYLSKID